MSDDQHWKAPIGRLLRDGLGNTSPKDGGQELCYFCDFSAVEDIEGIDGLNFKHVVRWHFQSIRIFWNQGSWNQPHSVWFVCHPGAKSMKIHKSQPTWSAGGGSLARQWFWTDDVLVDHNLPGPLAGLWRNDPGTSGNQVESGGTRGEPLVPRCPKSQFLWSRVSCHYFRGTQQAQPQCEALEMGHVWQRERSDRSHLPQISGGRAVGCCPVRFRTTSLHGKMMQDVWAVHNSGEKKLQGRWEDVESETNRFAVPFTWQKHAGLQHLRPRKHLFPQVISVVGTYVIGESLLRLCLRKG